MNGPAHMDLNARLSAPWVRYDPITATYRTRDGTLVAQELIDNIECLADVIRISTIRDTPRAAAHGIEESKSE